MLTPYWRCDSKSSATPLKTDNCNLFLDHSAEESSRRLRYKCARKDTHMRNAPRAHARRGEAEVRRAGRGSPACTGAQGANSPPGIHHGQGPRHGCSPGAQRAGGTWLLPVPWPVPSATDGINRMAGSLGELHPCCAAAGGTPKCCRGSSGKRPYKRADRATKQLR